MLRVLVTLFLLLLTSCSTNRMDEIYHYDLRPGDLKCGKKQIESCEKYLSLIHI